jgi:hypothetical protein
LNKARDGSSVHSKNQKFKSSENDSRRGSSVIGIQRVKKSKSKDSKIQKSKIQKVIQGETPLLIPRIKNSKRQRYHKEGTAQKTKVQTAQRRQPEA